MPLNMEKTYEMMVRAKMSTSLPEYIPSIKRKEWLKLLGVTMEEIPGKWDRHFEEMMNKASKRMYILRSASTMGSLRINWITSSRVLLFPFSPFAVEVLGWSIIYQIRESD